MPVTIGFYGAAGEVTGSNFLISTDQHQYVVDCGLFQGSPLLTQHNTDEFAYEPSKVEAMVVTHAHLDHIGRIPKLVRDGFRGPIYATQATIELATLTLKDALGLMDDKRHHPHGGTEQEHPVLYEAPDLQRTLAQFTPVEYNQPTKLQGDDEFTLFDAGHILGSATVLLQAGGKKLVFSGDIGHAPGTLLPAPRTPAEADVIVMETTYGDRERKDKDKLAILKEAIDWVVGQRGVLLIPAFAVERTQELLYLLKELSLAKQLPNIPIFLDSPLAIEALEVFQHHQELFNTHVANELGHKSAFDVRQLVLTPTVENSKDILEAPQPKIIIAGSGMMEGGRIHHHLRNYLSHPTTYVLVIGYQAPSTLGSRLIGGATEVHLGHDTVPVRAKVQAVDVFSSHADHSELIDWAKKIHLPPGGHVFLVHGDHEQSQAFRHDLAATLPGVEVKLAELGKQVAL